MAASSVKSDPSLAPASPRWWSSIPPLFTSPTARTVWAGVLAILALVELINYSFLVSYLRSAYNDCVALEGILAGIGIAMGISVVVAVALAYRIRSATSEEGGSSCAERLRRFPLCIGCAVGWLRWTLYALAGLLLLAVFVIIGVLLGYARGMYRPVAVEDEILSFAALNGAVRVTREDGGRGVTRIHASTEYDLFFAQGVIHAQQRFWQMEFQRRVGAGRLSEVSRNPTPRRTRTAPPVAHCCPPTPVLPLSAPRSWLGTPGWTRTS